MSVPGPLFTRTVRLGRNEARQTCVHCKPPRSHCPRVYRPSCIAHKQALHKRPGEHRPTGYQNASAPKTNYLSLLIILDDEKELMSSPRITTENHFHSASRSGLWWISRAPCLSVIFFRIADFMEPGSFGRYP